MEAANKQSVVKGSKCYQISAALLRKPEWIKSTEEALSNVNVPTEKAPSSTTW